MSIRSSDTGEEGKETPVRRESQHNVLVGIPAYNEEVAIGSVVLLAKTITENVLIIDDGSTDATAKVARKAGATVIRHESNEGKGSAIRTLFTQLHNENYDVVVLIDGDGQHVPTDIDNITRPILEDECDMVIGSRYIDRDRTETPLYRRFGQKLLDYATAGSSGTTVSDSQSGFRAFSPAAIEQLSITTNGYGVESEMISEATAKDLDISEVPVNVRYNEIDGQTHNPLSHGLSVLTVLLRLIKDRHPLAFFGIPGLCLVCLGGLVAVQSVLLYQSSSLFGDWRVVLGGISVAVGVLSLFSGLALHQGNTE